MLTSLCFIQFIFTGIALVNQKASLDIILYHFMVELEPSQQILLVMGGVYGMWY